uniref:(northern house mosquito) hypothetical protein n=1 Tax=Culex pipiens TaxID=7175 RepID=A0A8D8DUI3_CULPI
MMTRNRRNLERTRWCLRRRTEILGWGGGSQESMRWKRIGSSPAVIESTGRRGIRHRKQRSNWKKRLRMMMKNKSKIPTQMVTRKTRRRNESWRFSKRRSKSPKPWPPPVGSRKIRTNRHQLQESANSQPWRTCSTTPSSCCSSGCRKS